MAIPRKIILGHDTTTGEEVRVSPTDHLLIAGLSGTGKTSALRMLAQQITNSADEITYINLKNPESHLWSECFGVIEDSSAAFASIEDIFCKMMDDHKKMKKSSIPSDWMGPRRIIAVDEGEYLVKLVQKKKEAYEQLLGLFHRGRFCGVSIWWSTLGAAFSGPSYGLPSLIDSFFNRRLALRTANEAQTHRILGHTTHKPHHLNKDDVGIGFLDGYKNPIRIQQPID